MKTPSKRALSKTARPILIASLVASSLAAHGQSVGSIESNFNGTDIAGTSHLWFNAHVKSIKFSDEAATATQVTLHMRNSRVTLNSDGQPYSVQLPDVELTFSSTATAPSGSFSGSKWVVTVPKDGSDSPFLGGWLADVPDGGIPGGANPVTWTAEFSSSGAGIAELSWQWSAAVYEQGASDPNDLGVLFDKGERSAGTPMNLRDWVTGGGRGGGGSNFTGSWSATKSISDLTPVPSAGPTGIPTGTLTIPKSVVVKGKKTDLEFEIIRHETTFGFLP